MNANTPAFLKMMRHPFKFRMFLFSKLPAAWFSGVRIREMDESKCRVTIPYKWLTRNPFASTYFASLSMAAEMSTGALAMAHLYKNDPPISMLVVGVESFYYKKATSHTSFLCVDGLLFQKAVEDCVSSGESKSVKAKSIGTNKDGELVAEFYITWSFKARTKSK